MKTQNQTPLLTSSKGRKHARPNSLPSGGLGWAFLFLFLLPFGKGGDGLLLCQTTFLSEGFENPTFPPSGWTLTNPDTNATWSRVTSASGFGNSTACAKMDFFNTGLGSTGQVDYLDSPPINFSTASSPVLLTFNVAYCQYSALYDDYLIIRISVNGGPFNANTPYVKFGAALATAPQQTTAFTPAAPQWRAETVDLSSIVAGQSSCIIRFEAMTDWGNNCYVDDISISGVVGINEYNPGNFVSVFPNPTTGEFTVYGLRSTVQIQIINLYGEIVFQKTVNRKQATVNLEAPSGIYFLHLKTEGEMTVKKIMLEK